MKTLKIDELIEAEKTLSEMLKLSGHGLGYEINFNLHVLRKQKKDFFERLEAYKTDQFERDSDGNILTFVVEKNGEVLKKGSKEVILLPEGNNPKFEVQTKLEEGQSTAKRFPKDKIGEVELELQKFRDEEFTLILKSFNEKVLQNAFKNKKLDGVDITSLFGLLIE